MLLFFSLSTLPVAFAQEEPLHIDGPDPQTPLQECGSATFTFSGGAPPYTLEIKNGTDQPPLRVPLNASNDTAFTWFPVDFQEGTELMAEVKDSGQQKAVTDVFVVQRGDNSSCLEQVRTFSYQFRVYSDTKAIGNTGQLGIANGIPYILCRKW